MKLVLSLNGILWTAIAVITLNGCGSAQQTSSEEPLTYQVFYDKLSPYGTWIDYPDHGPVWNPNLDGDFRPYLTNGHWVATTAGWTWASDYRWGWAPFHYGRWLYDNRFGWLWIPGYEWSPAWVTWGSVDDYYCWAPLMPEVNVTIAFDTWSPAPFYWNMCPRSHITNPHLHHVATSGIRGGTRINPIRNYEITTTHRSYYAKGPSFDDVQRETRSAVHPIAIETIRKAPNRSSSDRVRVYSPVIEPPAVQHRRESQPSPAVYRSGVSPRQNTPNPAPDIQRKTQRDNIRSLPQERSTTRR
jgi:hypothetical protein